MMTDHEQVTREMREMVQLYLDQLHIIGLCLDA